MTFKSATKEKKESFVVKRYRFWCKDFKEIEENIWTYRGRRLLPKSQALSSTKHIGIAKTLQYISKRYYWVNIQKDVTNFIMSCLVCQLSKTFKGIQCYDRPLDLSKGNSKFKCIGIDIFGLLALPKDKGMKAVLTVIDYNTRYIKFLPLRNKSGKHIWEVLVKFWFSTFGLPKVLVSDNAKEFIHGYLKRKLIENGIKSHNSSLYSHHQNGITERPNRWLHEFLLVYKTSNNGTLKGWSEELNLISFRWNASFNSKVKETPQFLVFNEDNVSNLDFYVNNSPERKENWMNLNKKRLKEELDKVNLQPNSKVVPGDLVFIQWRRNEVKKFTEHEGPARVLEVISDNVVIVEILKSKEKKKVDTRFLKMCYSIDGSV